MSKRADGVPPEVSSSVLVEEYPRAASYDAAWQLSTAMGPNALWLAESLTRVLELEPGRRVLDLGCGKAASSIFMAEQHNVVVWAADLWIDPVENSERVARRGLEDRVIPISAEAHQLPFAAGYFDAIVSFDAYHYFGTDDLYAAYLAQFLRPGGRLGIVVPGLRLDFDEVPRHLRPYWEPAMWSFHSPEWWRRHLERSGVFTVEHADWLDDWELWAGWNEACAASGSAPVPDGALREAEMLRVDRGRNLGLSRVVARCAG